MSADLDSLFAQASSLSVASGRSRSASPSSLPARVGGGVGAEGGSAGSVGTRGRFNRGGGGPLSSKVFTVKRVSGSDPTVCFGSVGIGSASFCVRQNCSIKAHVDSKVEVWDVPEESRVFIVRSPGSTVFAEPSVSSVRIPSEVWANWERQQLTLSGWTREFCAVEIANDVSASVAEIKEESSFLEMAKDFRTPSKRVRESTSVSAELRKRLGKGEEGVSLVPHLRLLPVVVESSEGSETSPSGWTEGGIDDSSLSKVVSQVETSLVSLGEVLGVFMEESHNRSLEVDQEAKLIASALHSLSSSVGNQVELDERFEAPTLWGTTAFIVDEIMRLAKESLRVDLEVKPLHMEVGWLKTRVQDSAVAAEESLAKMMKILGMVMERIKSVGPELDSVKTRVGKVEAAQREDHQERSTKRSKITIRDSGAVGSGADANKASMDDLLWMLGGNSIDSPTSSPRPHLSSTGRLESQTGVDSPLSPNRGERGIETARLFKQLVADVSLLKATVKDDSVKFGGLGLRSIQDCQEWIHTHFVCYRYGLMMDPLLLLDRICGDDGIGTKSNKFKTWESRLKLKITTGAEESALHAISVKRPQLFHVGKTAMVSERNKSKLNQLPNFAAWKSGGEGVRNYIVKQMNSLYSTLTHEIAYALGSDPRFSKADTLAIRSLNDSITFLTQLMNFVDMSYERLLVVSKFTPEQAWSLTTQILDRIMRGIVLPKVRSVGSYDN